MGTFITGTSTPTVFADGTKQSAPGATLRAGWTNRNVLLSSEANVIEAALQDSRTAHRQIFNVKNYGAVGDGVTDDTAAIQAAIDAAHTGAGSALFLPLGTYLVSSTLTVTKGLNIYGEGWRTRILVAASMSASADVIKFSPSTASDDLNTDFTVRRLYIKPVSGTPARHAIAIDIGTRAAYHIEIRRVRTGALGGRAIATLPAATWLTDGCFLMTVDHCTLSGGIYLDKAGDSIRIARNTLFGANVAIYVDLVRSPSDGGAHGLEITGNNITSNGGALLVKNAWAGRFELNNVECPTPSGVTNNAVIDIDGTRLTSSIGGTSRTGTTVTVTTTAAHGLTSGEQFYLSPGEADFAAGMYTITGTPTTTTFTYTNAGATTTNGTQQTIHFQTNNFVISRNFASAASGYDVIRVNSARHTVIAENYIAEPVGGGYNYKTTANAFDTEILFNTSSGDTALSTQLSDSGSRTSVVQNGIASHLELTRSIWLTGANTRIKGKDTAGTAIPILGVDSNDNTVVVGPTTAPTSNGHLRFYAAGNEVGRFAPTGEFLVGATSPTGGSVVATFDGDVALTSATTGTSVGSAGAATALPAQPTGYLTVKINGTDRKIPYYAT